jgi:type IV pilus assembly protein PilW
MDSTSRRSCFYQAGFTLVELMVGLAIGLLSTVIIIQVISVFEAQRRTTTGSADAQTNGGIAMFTIGRDVRMAGYPLLPVTDSALECTTLTFGATGISGINPVTIAEGVATAGISASDTITIRYGNSHMGGVPTQITAMSGNDATVGNNLGCQVNDITLTSSGTSCAMSKATAVSAAGTLPITVTLQNTIGAGTGANLACLGAWNEISYAVNPATGNLDRTSVINGVSITTPSVVGVVNLQAQYGISATANSNQVAQWVNASGGTWGALAIADRNRIKAVRIAVVARNVTIELPAVTTACSSTTAPAPTGLCAWEGSVASPAPAIDMSIADANWSRYRYRVFETIVPLRNVIWSKDTL